MHKRKQVQNKNSMPQVNQMFALLPHSDKHTYKARDIIQKAKEEMSEQESSLERPSPRNLELNKNLTQIKESYQVDNRRLLDSPQKPKNQAYFGNLVQR